MAEPSENRTPGTRVPDVSQLVAPAEGLQHSLQNAGSFAAASYTLVGAIVLIGGIGYFADGWFESSPWLLIIGLLLGIVVGFYELARVVWRRTP